MAAVTAPGMRRSVLGKVTAVLSARRKTGKPGRLTAVLAQAREHVVTVAALASVDIGAFHGGQIAGWVVTGVSLLALDFAVRG